MTFFFFVVGLEARREFDLGELRERRRVALPLLAGLGGMVVPVAIYLAINAGHASVHGWGTAMSTDTAFALGLLALVGPRLPDRLRAFILTVVVVDDIVALVVIAIVYSGVVVRRPAGRRVRPVRPHPARPRRRRRIRPRLLRCSARRSGWRSTSRASTRWSIGLAMGRDRPRVSRAASRPRARERPLPPVPRAADGGARARRRGSGCGRRSRPNERLQQLWHPWTSYAIVPLFALANAGHRTSTAASSRRRLTSPSRSGSSPATSLGKPIGVLGATWLATRLSRGRLRPPVGWAAVAGAGTIAGIGFTVSLLIATSPSTAAELEEAKVGVLSAALRRCGADVAACSSQRRGYRGALRIRTLLGTRGPDRRPRGSGRPGARPHPRPARRAGHGRSSTATSSARTAARPSRSCASCCAQHGDVALRVAAPAVERRPPASAAGGRGGGGGGRARRVLGDARPAARAPGRAGPADLVALRRELGLDVERFRDDLRDAHAARSTSPRTSTGRSVRRLRHTDLLHQRPPPLRRLRHRDAVGGREGRTRTRARSADCVTLSARRRELTALRTSAERQGTLRRSDDHVLIPAIEDDRLRVSFLASDDGDGVRSPSRS